MSQIWSEKYRPSRVADIVGQNEIVAEITEMIDKGVMQHYLIHSVMPGVGKTTMAYCIADELDWQIHIFNASSKKTRGIDFVEEELIPLTSIGREEQIILLDEADQLTPAAQSALKGVIENSQGYFILTCNDISKVSDYLQSRCALRTFRPLTNFEMSEQLFYISRQENLSVTSSALDTIIKYNEGDLRNAIGALQSYCLQENEENRKKFLMTLTEEGIDCKEWLLLTTIDKDFINSLKRMSEYNTKHFILAIFNYVCYSENAKTERKMQIIKAVVTALRDQTNGIHDDVVKCNFIRMCME